MPIVCVWDMSAKAIHPIHAYRLCTGHVCKSHTSDTCLSSVCGTCLQKPYIRYMFIVCVRDMSAKDIHPIHAYRLCAGHVYKSHTSDTCLSSVCRTCLQKPYIRYMLIVCVRDMSTKAIHPIHAYRLCAGHVYKSHTSDTCLSSVCGTCLQKPYIWYMLTVCVWDMSAKAIHPIHAYRLCAGHVSKSHTSDTCLSSVCGTCLQKPYIRYMLIVCVRDMSAKAIHPIHAYRLCAGHVCKSHTSDTCLSCVCGTCLQKPYIRYMLIVCERDISTKCLTLLFC